MTSKERAVSSPLTNNVDHCLAEEQRVSEPLSKYESGLAVGREFIDQAWALPQCSVERCRDDGKHTEVVTNSSHIGGLAEVGDGVWPVVQGT